MPEVTNLQMGKIPLGTIPQLPDTKMLEFRIQELVEALERMEAVMIKNIEAIEKTNSALEELNRKIDEKL